MAFILTHLSQSRSKETFLKVIDYVGINEERYGELMHCFFEEERKVSDRAAQIISLIFDRHPQLIAPYVDSIISKLEESDLSTCHKRIITRILQYTEIPPIYFARILNICFSYLEDPREAITVRVFSMTVLHNVSKYYPEIKNELLILIQNVLEEPNSSPGIKNRGTKIVKVLLEELKSLNKS